MTIKFIMRKDVEARLMAKWADAIAFARKAGLPFRIPDWERLRNYELEELMRDHFGDDDWVVCEWCPFNWIYCTYFYGASRHDLKEARANLLAWRPRSGMPDMDKPHITKRIDDEILKRPEELGEKQRWGQGIIEHLKQYEKFEEKHG
jgi:hypothetical protein